jgi:hypothetical protein
MLIQDRLVQRMSEMTQNDTNEILSVMLHWTLWSNTSTIFYKAELMRTVKMQARVRSTVGSLLVQLSDLLIQ